MCPETNAAAPESIQLDVAVKPRGNVVTISSSDAGADFLNAQQLVYDTAYSPQQTADQMNRLLQQSQQAQKTASVLNSLASISDSTGGYVQFIPDMSYVPVLVGNDGRPVFLYDFVEVIDGLLDYDDIKAELPTLSLSQITGAIEFLRKVAQFNSKGIDIDELEDMHLVQDQGFLDELRAALADRENMRVLNADDSKS